MELALFKATPTEHFGRAFMLKRSEEAHLHSPRQIVVRQRGSVGREDWNRFLGSTDGSYQASYDHLRALALKGAHRLMFLELFDGDRKIAQCGVLNRGKRLEIQDGLQMLPVDDDRWTAAMTALLRHLGPGRYVYGGLWSCEADRQDLFPSIAGVKVEHVRPFAVQGVDFAKWPSWDRYWAKVSDSVRYESKYAPERVPGLHLEFYSGASSLKAIKSITDLQQASYARKGLSYSRIKEGIRYAYYMMMCRRSSEIVLARADEGVLAAYYGDRTARATYYIYGGQKAGSGGANWYLLKEMTRRAFESNPTGRFVMGNFDPAVHDEATGGGLLRSRRALRVSDFATSIVTFQYSGG